MLFLRWKKRKRKWGFAVQPVVEGASVIRVVCDQDGAWQFFSAGDFTLAQGRLIHIAHITEADPSIAGVMHRLEPGTYAQRQDIEHQWAIGDERELAKIRRH